MHYLYLFFLFFFVQHLRRSTWWALDGTFKLVPEGWKQLLTIHAKQSESFIPCMHILLPKKSANTYNRCFVEVRRILEEMNVEVNAEHDGYLEVADVNLDFESGMFSAFRRCFPSKLLIQSFV